MVTYNDISIYVGNLYKKDISVSIDTLYKFYIHSNEYKNEYKMYNLLSYNFFFIPGKVLYDNKFCIERKNYEPKIPYLNSFNDIDNLYAVSNIYNLSRKYKNGGSIIAGGYIYTSCFGMDDDGDIDVFFYGLNENEILELITIICNENKKSIDMYYNSKYTINIYLNKTLIQFILKCHESPKDIIDSFDIGSCCAYLDDEEKNIISKIYSQEELTKIILTWITNSGLNIIEKGLYVNTIDSKYGEFFIDEILHNYENDKWSIIYTH